MYKRILAVVLVFVSASGQAQVDTLQQKEPQDTIIIVDDFLINIDSSEIRTLKLEESYLNDYHLLENKEQGNVHIYDFKEKELILSQDLGTKGSPSILINQNRTEFYTVSSGMNDMNLYWHKRNPFISRKPFVDVLFVRSGTSADDELTYSIDHGQRIGHQWYYGVRFSKIGATGFYKEQTSNAGNFTFFTAYQNKKDNLFVFGELEFYRNILDHNGGVSNEPPEIAGLPRNQQGTNLTGVSSVKKTRNYRISVKNRIFDNLSLLNAVELSRSFYSYEELVARQNFYDTSFSASNGTYDSLRFNSFEYKLGLANYSKGSFNFQAGGKLNYSNFLSSSFTQIELQDSMSGGTYNPSVVNINSQFSSVKDIEAKYLGLFAKGDYSIENTKFGLVADYCLDCDDETVFMFQGKINHSLAFADIELSLGTSSLGVPLIFKRLNTNHLRWDNLTLKNPGETFIGLNFHNDLINLNINYSQFSNRLFMDSTSRPIQVGENLSSLTVNALVKYNPTEWFFLQSRNYFQFSSDDYYLRAPKYWNFSNLYFLLKTKRGVKFRLGSEILFTSDYSPYSYSPSISQFTLAEGSAFINTQAINPFFSIEVETVRIFLKMENASQNLFSSRIYSTYNYPEADRVLRIGAAWTFYN